MVILKVLAFLGAISVSFCLGVVFGGTIAVGSEEKNEGELE
jgi:hypothetical protein